MSVTPDARIVSPLTDSTGFEQAKSGRTMRDAVTTTSSIAVFGV
jgi:hypothetical protein